MLALTSPHSATARIREAAEFRFRAGLTLPGGQHSSGGGVFVGQTVSERRVPPLGSHDSSGLEETGNKSRPRSQFGTPDVRLFTEPTNECGPKLYITMFEE